MMSVVTRARDVTRSSGMRASRDTIAGEDLTHEMLVERRLSYGWSSKEGQGGEGRQPRLSGAEAETHHHDAEQPDVPDRTSRPNPHGETRDDHSRLRPARAPAPRHEHARGDTQHHRAGERCHHHIDRNAGAREEPCRPNPD